MSTYSFTQTTTFTVTHARHLASKIAADLNACSRLHGNPPIQAVENYNSELVELLRYGYLKRYEFGFERNGERILSWAYEVDAYGNIETDDRAGKMSASVDLDGCSFFNYLWYTEKFRNMDRDSQEQFKGTHPVNRTAGDPPKDGLGYWTGTQKVYSAGGTGISRNSFRTFQ